MKLNTGLFLLSYRLSCSKQFFVLLLIMVCSCKKDHPSTLFQQREEFIDFLIPEGEHFALQSTYKIFQGSSITYAVRFNSTAIYSTKIPGNQADINKLFGFAEKDNHHENSARFGWNWANGALHLYAYTYFNEERNLSLLQTIAINKVYTCSIAVKDKSYIFSIGDQTYTFPRAVPSPIVSGYLLYPYFGGDEAAPHDIHIYLRRE